MSHHGGLPGVPGVPSAPLTSEERAWYKGYLSGMQHSLEYLNDAPTVAKRHFESCIAYLEKVIPMDDEACPRMVSKEDLLAGLKAGRHCFIDRRDAPELQDLLELEREGLVASKLEDIEPQYSRRRFWWVGK